MQQIGMPVPAGRERAPARFSGSADPRGRHRSQAGSVSVMWVIVIVVLWLATAGLWYGGMQDSARAGEQVVALNARLSAAEARLETEVDSRLALSRAVGYRDESVTGSTADVAAVGMDLAALRAELGLAEGQGPATLSGLVAALRDSLRSTKQQLAAARSDFEREVAARRTAEGAVNAVETNFRGQLDALNQQLADERQRADSQSRTDERRFADLLSSQEAADAAARNAQQALAELELRSRRELARTEAQLRALADHRTIEAPEQIDGAVLAVAVGAATAYIDVGSRDGLKAGTRFELLRTSKTGELLPRGSVEVRAVEHDMALVALLGPADVYDPMLPGDLVRSPFFERGRSRSFFLLGEFPLALSKEFLTARLTELGQKVHDAIGTSTDVLVLGETPLAEGDDAPSLMDSDEFKLAERLGLRIMRVSDLRDFLTL